MLSDDDDNQSSSGDSSSSEDSNRAPSPPIDYAKLAAQKRKEEWLWATQGIPPSSSSAIDEPLPHAKTRKEKKERKPLTTKSNDHAVPTQPPNATTAAKTCSKNHNTSAPVKAPAGKVASSKAGPKPPPKTESRNAPSPLKSREVAQHSNHQSTGATDANRKKEPEEEKRNSESADIFSATQAEIRPSTETPPPPPSSGHPPTEEDRDRDATATAQQTTELVSRQDFLAFLDLLAKDEEAKDSDEKEKKPLTLEEERLLEHEELCTEWRKLPYCASLARREAEALSSSEGAGPNKAGELQPSKQQQQKVQIQEEMPKTSDLRLLLERQRKQAEEGKAAETRFEKSVDVLEDMMEDPIFLTKITAFCHQHHKEFLQSRERRQQGEFSHKEFALFQMYSEGMQQAVVNRLQRKVPEFDLDEFFEMLFSANNEDLEGGGGGPSEEGGAGTTPDVLSTEAWELILSFLKFECFCDMMDDYIDEHYGASKAEGTIGAKGKRGLKSVQNM